MVVWGYDDWNLQMPPAAPETIERDHLHSAASGRGSSFVRHARFRFFGTCAALLFPRAQRAGFGLSNSAVYFRGDWFYRPSKASCGLAPGGGDCGKFAVCRPDVGRLGRALSKLHSAAHHGAGRVWNDAHLRTVECENDRLMPIFGLQVLAQGIVA